MVLLFIDIHLDWNQGVFAAFYSLLLVLSLWLCDSAYLLFPMECNVSMFNLIAAFVVTNPSFASSLSNTIGEIHVNAFGFGIVYIVFHAVAISFCINYSWRSWIPKLNVVSSLFTCYIGLQWLVLLFCHNKWIGILVAQYTFVSYVFVIIVTILIHYYPLVSILRSVPQSKPESLQRVRSTLNIHLNSAEIAELETKESRPNNNYFVMFQY